MAEYIKTSSSDMIFHIVTCILSKHLNVSLTCFATTLQILLVEIALPSSEVPTMLSKIYEQGSGTQKAIEYVVACLFQSRRSSCRNI